MINSLTQIQSNVSANIINREYSKHKLEQKQKQKQNQKHYNQFKPLKKKLAKFLTLVTSSYKNPIFEIKNNKSEIGSS
jgi:hypothetical protein